MSFSPIYNLIEELKWRGLFHQDVPGTEELLMEEMVSGYVGFDPTADSLHIGNMVPIILLVHLQRAGHKPYALVGGATGMVGDPSGKKSERTLLDIETINHNLNCQKAQLEQFLEFDCGANSAEVVNNYDWFKNVGFLEFIRDVGKHISVNYMMAKDSVKNRLEDGMSFTEFSYQLVQGYDFYHLWESKDVKLQMGGSDQWGNIVTGTELIRRKGEGKGYSLTAPLLTKSDGSKMGKSEGKNIWLDPERTSPYEFYQYWLNVEDKDVIRLIKIFTLYNKDEIEDLLKQQEAHWDVNFLKKELAKYVTTWVHGEIGFNKAFEATQILFGKGTAESIKKLSENDFLNVFSGVNQADIENVIGANIVDLLADSGFIESKSQAKRDIKGNAISVNSVKVKEDYQITADDLINSKYVLLQKGRKNKFIVVTK